LVDVTSGLDDDGRQLFYLRDLAKVHHAVSKRGQSRADKILQAA
jgi:hypothetical protein